MLDEHVWHRFDHDLARIVRLNQLEEEVLYLLPDFRAVFEQRADIHQVLDQRRAQDLFLEVRYLTPV